MATSLESLTGSLASSWRRFQQGLGMGLVAKSDLSTQNTMFASYVLKSNDLCFVFTAPYSRHAWKSSPPSKTPMPHYDQHQAHEFIASHGLAVRAVGEQLPWAASFAWGCMEPCGPA
jgi:4-hydroxyphenylpyruvate dioxygenase